MYATLLNQNLMDANHMWINKFCVHATRNSWMLLFSFDTQKKTLKKIMKKIID